MQIAGILPAGIVFHDPWGPIIIMIGPPGAGKIIPSKQLPDIHIY
jgi:ATP-dependent Lon protease